MADGADKMLDTFLAKIALGILKRSAENVLAGSGPWIDDWVKTLATMGLDDVRDLLVRPPHTKPGGEGWGVTEMSNAGGPILSTMNTLVYKVTGVAGLLGAFLTLSSHGIVAVEAGLLDQMAFYNNPFRPPDPASLATAYIKGSKQVGLLKGMRLHGLDKWAQETILDSLRLHLSPSDYWTLYRRKVLTGEDFSGDRLRQTGLFDADRALIDRLNEQWPGLADIFTAFRRGGLTESGFADALDALGYRKGDVAFYDDVLRPDLPLDALTRLWRYGDIERETYKERLGKLGYRKGDLEDLANAARVRPDFAALITLERRGVITLADLDKGLRAAGYDQADRTHLSVLRHDTPDPTTAITWRRRGLIDDATLMTLFKSGGLSPTHAAHMKELTWLIPGVGDLVSMAVREAFTPSAIEQFQLHEDFPADFAKWAEKSGLSEFWAKAYWAAHWQLPGIQQVFEIFHRIDRKTHEPLISVGEVDAYLKVADISPYWRPHLRAISYQPYTRVDVRRMFQAEVIDRQEVFDTYRDLGYDEAKAETLTAWTEKAYPPDKTDLTRADILDAYRKGLLTREVAAKYLKDIGLRDNDISFYLARTDFLMEQDKKEVTLSSLKTMFMEDLVTISQVRDRLHKENYEEGEIARLVNLWQTEKEKKVAEKAARRARPTRSELDAFLRTGVIGLDEYEYEMGQLGYSDKYIWWFIAAVFMGAAGSETL